MSEMIPPELMQMLGAAEPMPEEAAAEPTIADAINLIHQLMVSEADPQSVSMLGAVLNQLTTMQAKKASG